MLELHDLRCAFKHLTGQWPIKSLWTQQDQVTFILEGKSDLMAEVTFLN